MKSNITVVINTLNEEQNLPRALNSIKDFADEIVVVDMKSDDRTAEIAKQFGAKVFEHVRTDYVEPARNFAISKATGDWILILDADETVTHSLIRKFKRIMAANEADYYRVPRKNLIFGKWMKHSRWWPDYNVRFFRKGFAVWSDVIHSVPITQGRGADLRPLEKNALVHYHYETIDQFITRLNRYTTIQAKSKVKEGYQFSWKDLINRPVAEFLSRYFDGRGYKDGIHGLAVASLQGFSELVLYLKIWQLKGFEEKQLAIEDVLKTIGNAQSDTNYWRANTKVIEKKGIHLVNIIKRKFKLA